MQIGIIGLPNAGKSTIFNALTSGHAVSADYPFTTIDPNIGVISIADPRVERLAEIYKPKKATHATIRFVDIAGLVKGASSGEGLGNKFLSHIREVDAIIHVVRVFEDENVSHPMGSVDPIRDIEIITTELLLADLQTIEKQIETVSGAAKSGEKKAKEKLMHLEQMNKALGAGKSVNHISVPGELLSSLFLLSSKPVLYVGNCGESTAQKEHVERIEKHAKRENSEFIGLSGKLESEIIQLPDNEKNVFRKEMGVLDSGVDQLVKKSFSLLGLITFFTGRSVEVRAWTIPDGTKAPRAAGKIHTDMEKGFIKAEITSFNDLDQYGSEAAVKEKGLMKLEGKDYIMQEGDVAFFRFSA
ncbi:MAG: redox-regulated ATPase YchF [bacterium]